MTDAAPVQLETTDHVATIRFSNPASLNAIDAPTAIAFRDICQSIANQSSTRCIVVRGEGRAFMAGGDISTFGRDPGAAPAALSRIITPFHQGLQILREQDAPVIAVVHGMVVGAGLGLAMGCDFVIASEDTRFLFAYTSIGGTPDGGNSFHLPRLVGTRRAMELALLNDPVSATDARDLGLVNRVVPPDTLDRECIAIAEKLAAGPTRSFGATRRLFDRSFRSNLEDQMEAERLAFMSIATTDDFAEGCAAFLEKRQAQFTGD